MTMRSMLLYFALAATMSLGLGMLIGLWLGALPEPSITIEMLR